MVFQSTTEDLLNSLKHDHRYYVDIPHNLTNIEEQPKEFNVVNLYDNLHVFTKNYVLSHNFNIGIFVYAQLVFITSFTYKTNKLNKIIS